MDYGRIPVETLLDYSISTNINAFKLSVAWLIRKIFMENEKKIALFFFVLFFFFLFLVYFTLGGGEVSSLD